MNASWLAYVPHYLARDIVAHPAASPIRHEQRMDVVSLFADVSGFTPISEALSKLGKVGAEELTLILNGYFEPMIDLVLSYGGMIGKFAGDAMTVLFPYADGTRADAIQRAIQCALDMQANMERYAAIETQVGTFGLAMKAGLALGPVFCTTVGDPAVHQEYIIAGRALDLCADAEHLAEKGEVIVHNDLLADVSGAAVVEDRGGFSCITALEQRAARQPLEPLSGLIPDDARETLAAYLHPTIAQRLRSNQGGFINEHRRVTVLFVSFSGFDYDGDPRVGEKLQDYLLEAMEIVARYDGYFSKADMGDKGSKYIVLFGTPVSHENDEDRALRCALDLIRLPHSPARIGVNTGFVYCGEVGSNRRKEYTVMGDAVNLAARLMQVAQPQQVLVSGFTQRYVADRFVWETFEPIRVKGKTNLIPIYEPLSIQDRASIHLQEPIYNLPMVGRAQELQLAAGKIALAQQGRGQIIGITAEAGMGKSRLNAEIIRLAANRGLVGYGGECQSHGTNVSYLVWRNVWRGFFGLDPAWEPERQLAHLDSALTAIDPDLVGRMPLLDVVLNITIPDNAVTQSLDARLRKESLEALLLDCLTRRAQDAPMLIVLEDCQWIDPLSRDLLEFIGRNLSDLRVVLIALYRPPEIDGSEPIPVRTLPHFTEIRLVDFSPEEAEQLIRLKLAQQFGVDEDSAIYGKLIERIKERAQGNPFYIDEIVNFIHDRQIDLHDVKALEQLELPESLHSLIISRIDQLTEDKQITLKVASIIGRLFKASWLWSIYPQLGHPEEIKERLETLSDIDLTPLDKPEPELEYLFKHVVTQEVAYESMAVATRSGLHEQLGNFIENRYTDSLDLFTDVLAFHYGRSRNTDKQRVYFRRAGDSAQSAYANQVAIDYYQRLLPLLAPEEQPAVLISLGQVYQLIGKWTEAEATYRQALALAETHQQSHVKAECQMLLGHLMWYKAAYPDALDWLDKARANFEQLGDQRGVALATGRAGLAHRLQGNYADSLACFERQAAIARELDDKHILTEAVGHMGNVYKDQGDLPRALACYEQQLQIADAIGERREYLYAVGNEGLIYQFQGDYAQALDRLSRALDSAEEIGDQHTVAVAAINMGEIYRLQGEYEQAAACYAYGMDTALELDDRMAIMVAMGNIALTYTGQGRYTDADPLFVKAVGLAQTLNIPYFQCEYLYGRADCYARQRRYTDAQPINDEALRIATQIDRQDIRFQAELLAVALRVATKQIDTQAAVAALQAIEAPGEPEKAAVTYEVWRLNHDDDQRREATNRYRELYARTPNVEYRQHLEQLINNDASADAIPPAPTLPPLPDVMTGNKVDLAALLAQVEARIGTNHANGDQTLG